MGGPSQGVLGCGVGRPEAGDSELGPRVALQQGPHV